MDKEFMIDFYENYYEDPLFAAVEDDMGYQKEHKKLVQAEEELMRLIGGFDTPAGEKIKEYIDLTIKLDGYIGLDSYLQGAADRERMLH